MSATNRDAANRQEFDPSADAEIPDVHDDPSWSPESAARFGRFVRPSEADERRALRWLMDVRENGGPLERGYARSVIETLSYFEQEAPVDTRP